jgi:hypothetical protein
MHLVNIHPQTETETHAHARAAYFFFFFVAAAGTAAALVVACRFIHELCRNKLKFMIFIFLLAIYLLIAY